MGGRRFAFLDGIRGVSALYVAAHHARLAVVTDATDVSNWLRLSTAGLGFGRFAVSIFIVLSGFCLMLPVTRSAQRQLRSGVGGYMARRARRLLPPYFAALTLTLGMTLMFPWLNQPSQSWWGYQMPALDVGAILSHVALVHVVFPQWIFKINGPLWSVATEWHIYWIFALLLLPTWRRFGGRGVIAVACAVGLVPLLLARAQLGDSGIWLLACFAFGVAAAAQAPDATFPWGKISCLLWLVVLPAAVVAGHKFGMAAWAADWIAGAAAALLILFLSNASGGERAPWLLRLFESKPATRLGAFSYSIYLVHAPLFGLADLLMRHAGASADVRLLGLLAAVLPASVAVAYAFHRVFERPFMSAAPEPLPRLQES